MMSGLGRQVEPKYLVSFKAGMMDYDGRMVTPKRDKGILRVVPDE